MYYYGTQSTLGADWSACHETVSSLEELLIQLLSRGWYWQFWPGSSSSHTEYFPPPGNKCSLIYLIFSSTSLDWCRKPELDWPSDCCCWRISISPQSVLAGWRVLVVVQSVQAHHNYPPVVHVTSNSPEYNKSYCRPSLLFYFLQNYIFFLLSHTTRDNLLWSKVLNWKLSASGIFNQKISLYKSGKIFCLIKIQKAEETFISVPTKKFHKKAIINVALIKEILNFRTWWTLLYTSSNFTKVSSKTRTINFLL